MNEREIERKLAEILSSRGNILPGFSSNGGQLGDQIMVSLDGIRDAVSGIALTSIPPGKIGAVFDKSLNQWYILSNELPIEIRQDKTERKHKEKPKQPDSSIRIPPLKEFPKILVLHKNPNLDTKLYEYYRKEFKFRMALQQINYETLRNSIYLKYYKKEDYYSYYLENPDYYYLLGYEVRDYKYYLNKPIQTIKEENKKCDGVTDVGSGTSGTGGYYDPYVTESIRKIDSIIKSHPYYKFYVYFSSKHREKSYVMAYFWGQYRTTIVNERTAESYGELKPLPNNSNSVHEDGGRYISFFENIIPADFNNFGYGNYVSCGDVNTCESRTKGNIGENHGYTSGYIFVSSSASFNSITSSLQLQENYHGSINGRECSSLYVPQDYVCWVNVTGTSDYSYNYKISGFQAEPPDDPEYINDVWPGADYINGGNGSPGEQNYTETCIFPEAMENIFNVYKLYFYFNKKQYYLNIKPRSRTDQDHKVYYSTYSQTKNEIEYHYDIITQKLINFVPPSSSGNPNPTNQYKIIYIDLFYFDETKQEIHNFTAIKCYYGFRIPYDSTANTDYQLNTAIPWEYKIYKKESNTNKFSYKEEDIVYYNQNTQVVFTQGSYKPLIVNLTVPKMFEDWQIIIEKDWRRNISQVYPVVNETGDNQCIRNIRTNNNYNLNLVEPPITVGKLGTINFIDINQPIKEFQNQSLKDIIFTTNKKININRTDYDYNIGQFDPTTTSNVCRFDETGFKTLNIDGISNLEDGEYSLEAIVYSKNNKTKETTDV